MKMFGFDTLDWRQVKIDWDAITDDVIKAGTPMDKDGHICNDGNVYGILMDDVQRKRNVQGRVVISGCMDMKAAEEHSGITLSAEAKAALPDIWTQSGGVSSWNDIPDKPEGLPYVERGYGVVLPETTVETAQGGTVAVLPDVLDVSIGRTYDVSWNGEKYTCVAQLVEDPDTGAAQVGLGNLGSLTGGDSTGEPFVIAALDAETAENIGIGCTIMVFDGSTSLTVSIDGEIDIIHPIDPKCLPGGEYINLALLGFGEVEAGGETLSVECDTTNIRAALKAGTVKFLVELGGVKYETSGFCNGAFVVPVNAVWLESDKYFACVPITPYCRFYMQVDDTTISVSLTSDE